MSEQGHRYHRDVIDNAIAGCIDSSSQTRISECLLHQEGVINFLADRLACYRGTTMPHEIDRARRAVEYAKGVETDEE